MCRIRVFVAPLFQQESLMVYHACWNLVDKLDIATSTTSSSADIRNNLITKIIPYVLCCQSNCVTGFNKNINIVNGDKDGTPWDTRHHQSLL